MQHIHDYFEDEARKGNAGFAIAFALLQLADAQKSTAMWIKHLGNGDASTTFGAIEGFGMHIGEKLDALVEAMQR
jgi:hypothetical protein